MKKFLAVLLVGAVLFAIASCSPTEEVSIDPSPSAAYEKCSVHKKGSTGTHDLDICGQHYMCDGKQHYKATCQNRFACEEGNRERAECGHFACDGSLHEMLECKHYACDGNSHDLDICGQHYAYSAYLL